MLSGVTNPIYALKRIDNPVSSQARDQTKTANFDTVWNVLIANPDRRSLESTIYRKAFSALSLSIEEIEMEEVLLNLGPGLGRLF